MVYFQGILLIKHNNEWGTICVDDFQWTSGKTACNTLGLDYGYFSNRKDQTGDIGEKENTRIWMNDIHCDVLECSEDTFSSKRDCTGHWKDVVLICT